MRASTQFIHSTVINYCGTVKVFVTKVRAPRVTWKHFFLRYIFGIKKRFVIVNTILKTCKNKNQPFLIQFTFPFIFLAVIPEHNKNLRVGNAAWLSSVPSHWAFWSFIGKTPNQLSSFVVSSRQNCASWLYFNYS